MPRYLPHLLLAACTLFGSVSCRHWRCCNRDRYDVPPPRNPGGLSAPVRPGVIPPRDTIPPASVPTTPNRGGGGFDDISPLPSPDFSLPRRDTFSPGPILEAAPLPPQQMPWLLPPLPPSIADSPQPTKQPDFPKIMPPTRTEYTSKDLPTPDRFVFGEPIAPQNSSDLPYDAKKIPAPPERTPDAIMPIPDLPTPPTTTFPNESKKEILLPDELGPKLKSPLIAPPAADSSGTGLPNFSLALGSGAERIYAGWKPEIEGLDWLQKQKFRTVVYLHSPNQDTKPTRDLVEKRGMQFIGIPMSPSNFGEAMRTLTPILQARMNRPMYVFDDNGIRTGSAFYWYFRKNESLSNDQARARATALGLRDSTDSTEQKLYWLAIQNLLTKEE